MPDNRIKAMIDALQSGKMADANSIFQDEMENLVQTRLADKKIEVASRMTLRPEDIEHPKQEDHYGEIEDETRETGEIDADEYDSSDDEADEEE